jgi:hypothetical protein
LALQHLTRSPDGFGAQIGETLHLTVMRAEWWQEKIEKRFKVVRYDDSGGGRLIALATVQEGSR